jgi:rare lipoprotein A
MFPVKKWILGIVMLLMAVMLAPAAPLSRTVGRHRISRTARIRHRARSHRSTLHRVSQVGVASFYSNYYNGRTTANGERFSNDALTAASPDLPLGSRVKVTNLANHRSIVVRINDRGPYRHNRRIDLSQRAAQYLGFVRAGLANVRITRLS